MIYSQDEFDHFWSQVDRSSDARSCWLWAGPKTSKGYGRVTRSGVKKGAHVIAWEMAHNQPVPDGKMVCHTCDVPDCVRNDGERSHLYAGTHQTNSDDKMERGRHVASPGMRNGAHTKPWTRRQGVLNGRAKLTPVQVRDIRARHSSGEGFKALAREYDVSDTLIRYIVIGKLWESVA